MSSVTPTSVVSSAISTPLSVTRYSPSLTATISTAPSASPDTTRSPSETATDTLKQSRFSSGSKRRNNLDLMACFSSGSLSVSPASSRSGDWWHFWKTRFRFPKNRANRSFVAMMEGPVIRASATEKSRPKTGPPCGAASFSTATGTAARLGGFNARGSKQPPPQFSRIGNRIIFVAPPPRIRSLSVESP